MANTQYQDAIRELTAKPAVQSIAARQVMNYLNSLMGTVSVDTEALAKELEEALLDDGEDERGILKKMANTLTRLFGLTLVSRGDCIKISNSTLGGGEGTQLLRVNQGRAADMVAAIANVVEDCEKGREAALQRLAQMEGALSAATRDADNAKRGQDSLQKAQDRKDRGLLKAMQRILAQKPEMEPAREGEKDAFLLFLEDMELTWSWDADAAPDDFTNYLITDPAQAGIRMPCIYQSGALAVKGLRYSLKDESAANDER